MKGNNIIEIDYILEVRVRKYPVDIEALQECLIKAKKESKKSTKEIAKVLGLKETTVAHYFRTDKYFAIPEKEDWLLLKDLLHITTDKFDESIMSFIYRDGVYDQNNRLYSDEGICPTITCVSNDIKVVLHEK